MKNLIVLLIVFIWTRGILRSQDFHFSQYNENPALVNPALTGATSALRASLVYKDQDKAVDFINQLLDFHLNPNLNLATGML